MKTLLLLIMLFAVEGNASDPLVREQWALDNKGVPQPVILNEVKTKWFAAIPGMDLGLAGVPEGQRRVRVAVLDTGIDVDHPDLKALLRRKPQECVAWEEYRTCRTKGNVAKCKDLLKVDSDQNGYPADCAGWDATTNTPLINDEAGHGTHVAGLIAARKNGVGIEGIIQNVDLIPVRVLGAKEAPTVGKAVEPSTGSPIGNLTMETVARGLLYAIQEKADVISLSLGWPSLVDSKNVRDLIALAQDRGILVVAAAGNDSTDAVIFPCAYPGVICVGATDPSGKTAYFSNFGFSVDVTAPGLNILSDWPQGFTPNLYTEGKGYEFKNGTSMATPMVAGVLARLLSAGLTPEAARAKLLVGARKIEGTKYMNFGQVDLKRALDTPLVPLIVPNRRDPVRLNWDFGINRLEAPVALNNIGADASEVALSFRVVRRDNPSEALDGFTTTTAAGTINSWKFDEQVQLKVDLQLDSSSGDPESEGLIEILVTVLPLPTRKVLVPFELIRRIKAEQVTRRRPLVTSFCPINPDDLQTVEPRDDFPSSSYVSLSGASGKVMVSVIRREGDSMIQKFCTEADLPGTSPLAIQRVNWDLTGDSETVLVFPRSEDGKSFIEFHVFDTAGNRVALIKHDQAQVPLVGQFQWLPYRGRRSPVWVGIGGPAIPLPFDPWDPKKKPEQKPRVYVLAMDGLQELATGDKVPLALLPQVRLLLGTGDRFEKSYFIAPLTESGLGEVLAMNLAENRQLFNQAIAPLLPSGEEVLTQISLTTGVRLMRIDGLGLVESSTDIDNEMDPIRRVLGVYSNSNGSTSMDSYFGQSRYRMVFSDLKSGETMDSDLRRFSFLSTFHFDRLFSPVTLQTASGPIPAAFVPEGVGTSLSSELLVPRRTSRGALRLVRPAAWRIKAPDGCRSLNPVRTPDGATDLVYACPDQMLFVPVSH